MSRVQAFWRTATALLAWAISFALGWWWHAPHASSDTRPRTSAQGTPLPAITHADLSKDPLWSQISSQDPFGLKREAPLAAGAAAPSAPASDAIVWRFAALTENRGQRNLLLTAPEQQPLLLKEGDKLPNGERIKSIDSDRIQLQDARGRKRTIQLIEP